MIIIIVCGIIGAIWLAAEEISNGDIDFEIDGVVLSICKIIGWAVLGGIIGCMVGILLGMLFIALFIIPLQGM